VKLLAAGLTLSLPAESPYDRQVMVEQLVGLLKRHGAVRLNAGRRSWWLTLTQRPIPGRCARCRRPLERAVQLAAGDVACVTCAARSVVSDPPDLHRPAA
jgi:hypothetical protein